MKKVCSLLLALVFMLMFVSPVLAASENMLKDPGFENLLSNGWPDEANWRYWTSNTLEQSGYVTTDLSRNGNNSSFIKHITKKRVTFAAHVVGKTELDKNKNYTFGGWFKLDDVKKQSVEPRKDNSGVGVYLCVVYKKGGVAGKDLLYQRSTKMLSGTSDWQNCTFTFNPAEGLALGADYIHICFVMAYATGTVYVDDMTLTETTDAVSEELLTNPDGSLYASKNTTAKPTTAKPTTAKPTSANSSSDQPASAQPSAGGTTTTTVSSDNDVSGTTDGNGTTAVVDDTTTTSANTAESDDAPVNADQGTTTKANNNDKDQGDDTDKKPVQWPVIIVAAGAVVAAGAAAAFFFIKKAGKK